MARAATTASLLHHRTQRPTRHSPFLYQRWKRGEGATQPAGIRPRLLASRLSPLICSSPCLRLLYASLWTEAHELDPQTLVLSGLPVLPRGVPSQQPASRCKSPSTRAAQRQAIDCAHARGPCHQPQHPIVSTTSIVCKRPTVTRPEY